MDFTLPVRVEEFIAMIKIRPAIWTTEKNKFSRQESWTQIMHELFPNYNNLDSEMRLNFTKKVMKKWTQIRDSYVKSEKKKQFMSESELERFRPYLYSDHLTFLQPVLTSIKRNKISLKSENTDSEGEVEETYETDPSYSLNYQETSNIKLEYVSVPQKRSYSSDDNQNVKVRLTDPSTSSVNDSADMHMSFFRGIVPSLENFNVDQVLEFQMGVLKLVKQIRNKEL